MTVDQLYSQLKSDPDNVELARQLWNELSVGDSTNGLGGINLDEPSPVTWKAILKCIHFSEQHTREILIDILKPLLRVWPRGSRRLLQNNDRRQDIYFSQQSILTNGAWQLCDTINYQREPYAYATVMENGSSELTDLTNNTGAWEETILRTGNVDAALKHGLPRLERLCFGIRDRILFKYLCNHTENAKVTRLSLSELSISDGRLSSLKVLFSGQELRAGLKILCLGRIHEDLFPIFEFGWPDLEQLVFSVSSETAFSCPLRISLAPYFPKLERVTIKFDTFNLPKLECIRSLIQAFSCFSEVEVNYGCSEFEMVREDSKEVLKCVENLTTQIDFSDDRISPPRKLDVESVSSLNRSVIKADIEADKIFLQFCKSHKTLRHLSLVSCRIARQFIVSEYIEKLTELESLTVPIFIDANNQQLAKMAFENLANHPIRTLSLVISANKELELEYVQFPETLTTLGLQISAGAMAIENCMKAAVALKSLYIHNSEISAHDLIELLSHPNCKELETLILGPDTVHFGVGSPTQDQLHAFAQLSLPKLRLIGSDQQTSSSSFRWRRLFDVMIEMCPNLLESIPEDRQF